MPQPVQSSLAWVLWVLNNQILLLFLFNQVFFKEIHAFLVSYAISLSLISLDHMLFYLDLMYLRVGFSVIYIAIFYGWLWRLL